MPFYSWQCDAGHVTRKFRSAKKFTDTVRCAVPECKKKAKWFLERPSSFNSSPHRIWLGSEVHGKKVNSDEVRADLEAACFSGESIPKDTQEAIEKTRLGVNK